jgi:hypothetical protein
MKRPSNPIDFQSKLEAIRKGAVLKTDLGTNVNKGIIQGKGGKYAVVEKEKKFEEAGVKRKKRNYVLYESKLGTEREKDLRKIEEAPKPKPKPKPVPRQRVEERIIQKKKRKEYLDNYQYHETKYVKNPKTLSVVTHQRLGEIIGGFYEESTYQRMTMNEPGHGRPKLYSEQTTTTTTRRGPQGQPTKTSLRSNTVSRTVPAQAREYRQEVKQYSSNTNKRNTPALRGSKTTTTTTKTTTTTMRSNSKPVASRGMTNTTTTTRTKTVTRGQSAGGFRGRRH